jgi:hypothetical protein
MPAIANLVVKKNDGTTDITYTAVVPSSGDGSNAIWKSQSVGLAPAHQPEFRVSSREASNGVKRALRATFIYPQIALDSTTNVTSVIDRVVISADWTMPKGMSQTDLNEAASQFGNLVAATLVKQSVQTGYAPT